MKQTYIKSIRLAELGLMGAFEEAVGMQLAYCLKHDDCKVIVPTGPVLEGFFGRMSILCPTSDTPIGESFTINFFGSLVKVFVSDAIREEYALFEFVCHPAEKVMGDELLKNAPLET